MNISFLIVEVGTFTKDAFMQRLIEWGFEPSSYVKEVEQRGRVVCGEYRVLRVA